MSEHVGQVHVPAADGRCQCIHDWRETYAAGVVYGVTHVMVTDHPDPARLLTELAHVDTIDEPLPFRGWESL